MLDFLERHFGELLVALIVVIFIVSAAIASH
jgi:hypothetical protein